MSGSLENYRVVLEGPLHKPPRVLNHHAHELRSLSIILHRDVYLDGRVELLYDSRDLPAIKDLDGELLAARKFVHHSQDDVIDARG